MEIAEDLGKWIGIIIGISTMSTALFSGLVFVLRNKLPFVNRSEFENIVIKVVALEEIQKISDTTNMTRHQEIRDLIRDNTNEMKKYNENIKLQIETLTSVKNSLSDVRDKQVEADKKHVELSTIVHERTDNLNNHRKGDSNEF